MVFLNEWGGTSEAYGERDALKLVEIAFCSVSVESACGIVAGRAKGSIAFQVP